MKLLYEMVFITRTAKFDRAFLSTGSYTSVLENLISPNRSGLEGKDDDGLSVQNHEMSGLHTESIDSACRMQIDADSFADTNEGTNTNTSSSTSSYYS